MIGTALQDTQVIREEALPGTARDSMISGIAKTSVIVFLMGLFILHSLSYELREPRKWRQRRLRARLAHRYAKLALGVLRIKVNVKNHMAKNPHGPRLLVGNHLSYIDALLLAAQRPVNFVTSVEVRETPGLGILTVLGGCLYVERRSRANLSHEVREISDALNRGLSVVVFPEATSTNGSQVLRFRQPLYRAAIDSERAVRPFCINYRSISGESVNPKNRDVVCWYDKMPFLPHLFTLASQTKIEVDIHWLHDIEAYPEMTCAQLAMDSHQAVTAVFVPHG